MSTTKEHHVARPQSQHRLSASSTPSSNLPIRHQTSRQHSHSVSLGTLNSTHRVTRRKSMTSTGANAAAIAAALSGTGQQVSHHTRQSWNLKSNNGAQGSEATLRNGTDSSSFVVDDDVMQDGDSVADGMPDGRTEKGISKSRVRRASEGAYLSKGEGKRSSGELRCEKCGKGYKHSSCLTKHLSVPCVSLLSPLDFINLPGPTSIVVEAWG
ncbi:MAG: hypothetical protein Q9223_006441 [Gallowayella weberi]